MKRKMSIAAVAAVVAAISLAGAGCGGDVALDYHHVPSAVVVEMSSSGGLAPAWIDGVPAFKLTGDGRVVKWRDPAKQDILITGTLSEPAVENLLERIKTTGFFGLEDEYFNSKIMDGATTTIAIALDSGRKSVSNYMSEVEPFSETAALLSSMEVPGASDYVPDKGYLYVRPRPADSTQPDDSWETIAGSIPAAATFAEAAAGTKPVEVDGETFVRIKKLEAAKKAKGINITIDGVRYTIYPVYEPGGGEQE